MIGSLGAAHSTAQSDGLMVPPDFIVSLCSKMKTACLHHPASVAGAGGRRGAGQGQEKGRAQGLGLFGSARRSVCFLRGEQRRSEQPAPERQAPLPTTSRSLPHPALPRRRTDSLLTLFAELFFFIVPRCARRRFGAGGVAEGLPRPPRAGEHPALRPRSAPPSPRVAQGPLPLHGARSGALSHRQPRRRVPPRRHHPAARGAALGCAGLPSSIYSRAPVTSGFTARGESQPTRVFLLCL